MQLGDELLVLKKHLNLAMDDMSGTWAINHQNPTPAMGHGPWAMGRPAACGVWLYIESGRTNHLSRRA